MSMAEGGGLSGVDDTPDGELGKFGRIGGFSFLEGPISGEEG